MTSSKLENLVNFTTFNLLFIIKMMTKAKMLKYSYVVYVLTNYLNPHTDLFSQIDKIYFYLTTEQEMIYALFLSY
jgi:hypothetical protein